MHRKVSGRIRAILVVIALSVSPMAAFVHAADEEHADHPSAEESQNGHEAGEHESGVPLSPKEDLAIWSLVVFLVLLAVLKKFAWGPIVQGLEAREGGIRKEIEDAQAAHEKAKALLAEHEYKMDKVQDDVREILAEARRDAEHARNEMMAGAQAETEAMKNRAVHEIERARDEALDQLFSHMADSVVQATQEVLTRSISESDDKQLIDDALAKFSPSNN